MKRKIISMGAQSKQQRPGVWDEAAEYVHTGHETSSLTGSPRQPLHHKDFVGMLLLQFAHHLIETVVQLESGRKQRC